MIKLIFSTPQFSGLDKDKIINQNGQRMVLCKLQSILLDTETKEEFAKNVFTGIAKCSIDDEFDPILGQDLSFSRAKSIHYKSILKDWKYMMKDSIKWIIGLSYISIFYQREFSHEIYLLENIKLPAGEEEVRRIILANVEAKLPLLRHDDGLPYFDKDLWI